MKSKLADLFCILCTLLLLVSCDGGGSDPTMEINIDIIDETTASLI
ncbi:MAG: hypothetical protein KKF44_05295 [Nanoarchaeota archaeon]|nr:hypothetical protein [Nanoarchaeota archaeon]